MSSRERDELLARLFGAAAELPPEDRSAFIERECAGDAALKDELESLLREDARGVTTALRGTALKRKPDVERIGKFRVLEVLGEGGMGVVYLAEEDGPVRRKVALKQIRFGMQTDEIAVRFRRESQALARMSHPGIAEIFECGTTEAGRPYFAMEYVAGVPITEHCDREHASIAERLELFGQACDAVQHAHQKGVLHRDLKPANVLVARQDGKAVVKIIDFGVAQALSGSLVEEDYHTTLGRVVGTYLYMSPEQADPKRPDLDTRSDVYSLGVLLYEMLTGASPYGDDALRAGDPATLQRAVLERDPVAPSVRVARLGLAGEAVARSRGTTAGALARRLRGDLDWIATKALSKDRARRYASASELKADVERHLANLPVEAGAPSTTYRVGRFYRRHRALVLLAALAVLSLVAALFATARAWRSTAAALVAEERRGAEVARRAELTEARLSFFEHALFDAPPEAGIEPMLVELLDLAVDDVARLYSDRIEAEAAVRYSLGRWYLALGENEKAEAQLLRAYAIQTGPLGQADLDVFYTLEALIRATRLARGAEAAEPYAEHSLDLAVALAGRDPELRARLVEMRDARRTGTADANQLQALLPLLARVQPDGEESLFLARVMIEQGLALHRAGRPDLGDAYFEELEASWHALAGTDRAKRIVFLWRLADGYLRLVPDRPDKAVALARELLAEIATGLPPGHWMHADARRILGLALARQEPPAFAEAEAAVLEAEALSSASPGGGSAALWGAANAPDRLVAILLEQGLLDDFLAGSWQRWRASASPGSWWPATRASLPSAARARVLAFLEQHADDAEAAEELRHARDPSDR